MTANNFDFDDFRKQQYERRSKEIELKNFEFWSQAKSNASLLTDEQFEQLENTITETYTEPTDTDINDLFWHEFDTVLSWLGLNECGKCGELHEGEFCEDCYEECEECYEVVSNGTLIHGLCSDCYEEEEE